MNSIVGLIAGFFASLGVGGGTVLLLYCSLLPAFSITQARNLNLLFFIPCALVSLVSYTKNKLIDYKAVLPLILFGATGVFIGYFINKLIEPYYLKKIIGAFIVALAFLQLKDVLKSYRRPEKKKS